MKSLPATSLLGYAPEGSRWGTVGHNFRSWVDKREIILVFYKCEVNLAIVFYRTLMEERYGSSTPKHKDTQLS
jgi:hypothetical protein